MKIGWLVYILSPPKKYNCWWEWPGSQSTSIWLIVYKPHKPPTMSRHPFSSIWAGGNEGFRLPNFTRTYSTLKFPLSSCFCPNYLTFQNSRLSQHQMDASSFQRSEPEARRKHWGQAQGLRCWEGPQGDDKQSLCI